MLRVLCNQCYERPRLAPFDGRRVVVKAGLRRIGAKFLAAVQTAQAHLVSEGFPCPRPLLGPAPLGEGLAVVEALLDRGLRADPHDPKVRAVLASTLARQIDLRHELVDMKALRPSLLASAQPGQLWPLPHDGRFDFEATARGAEWIDDLARGARERLCRGQAGEFVVAPSDWRAEHVRFEDDDIVASYDWQSLAVGREARLLGQIGHAFTADWVTRQKR